MTAFQQEKKYSCGSSAIRNCLLALGNDVPTERTIRRVAGTTKQGTDEHGIMKAIEHFGYACEPFYTENEATFKKRIVKILKEGRVAILCIQDDEHWISATGYYNKRIIFVDSDFKKAEQLFTVKEFALICKNLDKLNKKTFYYAIFIN